MVPKYKNSSKLLLVGDEAAYGETDVLAAGVRRVDTGSIHDQTVSALSRIRSTRPVEAVGAEIVGSTSVVVAAKEETRSISDLAYSWRVFLSGGRIRYLHLSSGWVLVVELLELRLGRQSPAGWTDAVGDTLPIRSDIVAGFPVASRVITSTVILSAIVLVRYTINSVSVELTWRWEFIV